MDSVTRETGTTLRTGGFDRRRAIKAGVIGAAGVWVAPAIDSVATPAAALSCTCAGPGTINWNSGAGISGPSPGIAGFAGAGWLVGTFNTVSVRFRISGSTASPYFLVFPAPNPDCLTGWQQTCTNGNVTGIFGLDKQNETVNAEVYLDIDFSCDVRNLSFTVLDIDGSNSEGNLYRDEVTMEAFRGATPVTATYTPVAPTLVPAQVPSFTPTVPDTTAAAKTFTALINTSPGAGSELGNVLVSVPGAVSRFRLTYRSVHASGTGTLQEVALSNLTWTCTGP